MTKEGFLGEVALEQGLMPEPHLGESCHRNWCLWDLEEEAR